MTRHTAPRTDTLERLRHDHDEGRRRRIRPAPPAPPARPSDAGLADRGHGTVGLAALAWWALLLGAAAIAPEAANPEQATLLSHAAELAQFGAILAVALAVASGSRPAAGGTMLAGGAVFLGSAVACVATGHHVFGTWWYGQAGATLAMMGLGAALLRRRRAR